MVKSSRNMTTADIKAGLGDVAAKGSATPKTDAEFAINEIGGIFADVLAIRPRATKSAMPLRPRP